MNTKNVSKIFILCGILSAALTLDCLASEKKRPREHYGDNDVDLVIEYTANQLSEKIKKIKGKIARLKKEEKIQDAIAKNGITSGWEREYSGENTFLHLLAHDRSKESVKLFDFMLQNFAEVKRRIHLEKNASGDTLLHVLAQEANEEFLSKIIEQGDMDKTKLINEKNNLGQTPLIALAASFFSQDYWDSEKNFERYPIKKMLQQFIQMGADVNAVDNNGSSALHWFASFGNIDCIDILIKNKANPQIKNLAGRTAEDYAKEFVSPANEDNFNNICELLKSAEELSAHLPMRKRRSSIQLSAEDSEKTTRPIENQSIELSAEENTEKNIYDQAQILMKEGKIQELAQFLTQHKLFEKFYDEFIK